MKTEKMILVLCLVSDLLCQQEVTAQWSYNGTHIYNSNSGYVGIGNNAPAKLLYVGQNMSEPTVTIRNFGGTGGATFQMIDDLSGADWKFKATTTGGFKIRDNAAGLDVMTFEPNSLANAIYLNDQGYLGLGTNTPLSRLHVEGDAKLHDLYAFYYADNTSTGGNSGLIMQYNNSYKAWMYYDQGEELLRINCDNGGSRNDLTVRGSDGYIGINTASPSARFSVVHDSQTKVLLGYTVSMPHYFHHTMQEADGDGQSALLAFQTRDVRNDGTGYGRQFANSAIIGSSDYGDNYSFGTSGYNTNVYYRCGGVLGSEYYGDYWGSLGYRNNAGTTYGGYFSSYAGGGGKSYADTYTGIGLGTWGDLFGADIHGKIYGAFIEGENYALYTHGDVYKDKLDIHLQDNENGTKTVLYTNTSTEVTVQTSGKAVLSGGKASISFDPAFTAALASEESLVITVTPLGPSEGVYLEGITRTGFSIAENNAGKSSVTVNYIAVGRRAGYEKPQPAKEVVDAVYAEKVTRGLRPDAELQSRGEGLYYENGNLILGIHPSLLPDPDRKPHFEGIPDQNEPIISHPQGREDQPPGSEINK